MVSNAGTRSQGDFPHASHAHRIPRVAGRRPASSWNEVNTVSPPQAPHPRTRGALALIGLDQVDTQPLPSLHRAVRRRHILIVEDDSQVAGAIQAALELEGEPDVGRPDGEWRQARSGAGQRRITGPGTARRTAPRSGRRRGLPPTAHRSRDMRRARALSQRRYLLRSLPARHRGWCATAQAVQHARAGEPGAGPPPARMTGKRPYPAIRAPWPTAAPARTSSSAKTPHHRR